MRARTRPCLSVFAAALHNRKRNKSLSLREREKLLGTAISESSRRGGGSGGDFVLLFFILNVSLGATILKCVCARTGVGSSPVFGAERVCCFAAMSTGVCTTSHRVPLFYTGDVNLTVRFKRGS